MSKRKNSGNNNGSPIVKRPQRKPGGKTVKPLSEEPYKFLSLGRKANSKYKKCIVCERHGCEVEDEYEIYTCMLFGGEPICDVCCLYEIDAGRGSPDSVAQVLEWTNMADQELYRACMMCQHSQKKGFYEIVSQDDYIFCYFGHQIKKPGVKNSRRKRADVFCNLFEKKCPFHGNSLPCKHGAWYNEALAYLWESIRRELILRGYDFDEEESE